MEFRWIALIAVWTLLAGPMFDAPVDVPKSQTVQARAVQPTAP